VPLRLVGSEMCIRDRDKDSYQPFCPLVISPLNKK
jgi:hypothetical protein